MLDPLTALGLAANVVQFVDFGLKVVSKSQELYQSAEGVLLDQQHFAYVADDLNLLTKQLKRSLDSSLRSGPLSDENRALADLSNECFKAARELSEALEGLRLPPAKYGQRKRFKSIRQGLKSVWNKDKVDTLAERLRNFRDELNTRILVSLRHDIDLLSIRQSNRFNLLGQATQQIIRMLLQNNDDLMKKLQVQTEAISHLTTRTEELLSKDMKATIKHKPVPRAHIPEEEEEEEFVLRRTNAILDLEISSEEALKASFEATILQVLYFHHMTERQDEVAEAHKRTFEWIYSDRSMNMQSWDDMSDWLRNGHRLYWINGKAGSGKSTLMKYLHDDKKTKDFLSVWSQTLPLVTATFFAWNAGDALQKSQEGLLRYLLYECLNQCGALVTLAFPRLWESWKDANAIYSYKHRVIIQPFNLKSLQEALIELLDQRVFEVRFCFFVDGLDEYEGRHGEIAQLFREVALSRTAKACVSSRPLLVFEHAFRGYPSLTLQDLTHNDIKAYVEDRFKDSQNYTQIQVKEPEETRDLEESIVQRASGVFLWVKLVVDSLLEGLLNYDRASDLQVRLEALPTDIEALYLHMFQNLDSLYLEEASRLFQIRYAAQVALSPLALALADEEDPDYVFKASVCKRNEARINYLSRSMEGRLKSRCKGLLELQSNKSSFAGTDSSCLGETPPEDSSSSLINTRVEWHHKSVPDYLKRPELWALLRSRAGPDFVPEVALLKSCILQVKLAVSAEQKDDFRDLVRVGLQYAAIAEMHERMPQTALVDELYDAVAQKWELITKTGSSSYEQSWFNFVFLGWLPDGDGRGKQAFFILCIMYGLFHYARKRLDNDPSLIHQTFDCSLLRVAVLPSVLTLYTWERSPRMVKLLLEKGADPNVRDDHASPWETTLNCVYQDIRRAFGYARWPLRGKEKILAEQWCEILSIFIQHGADPRAENRGSNDWGTKDEYELSRTRAPFALWVVQETFAKWVPDQGAQLESLLKKSLKGKSQLTPPAKKLGAARSKRRSISPELKKLFGMNPRSPVGSKSPGIPEI